MKRISFLILWVVSTLIFFAAPAAAATIKGDDTVNISNPINDDVYIFGGDVTVKGPIRGDLIIGAGNVRVTGPVAGDLMIGGGQVRIDGPVRNTIRVGGGQIVINSRVGRDVMVGGGTVELGPDSVIGGDLVAGAGTLIAEGTIDDDIMGGLGAADISGLVGGNVKISVDQLTLSDGARIRGDLKYESANKAEIDKNAEVAGSVTRSKPKEPRQAAPRSNVFGWLWSVAGMVLVALVIAWLLPGTMKSTGRTLGGKPAASFGIGFAALFLTPIAAILLIIFSIGLALPLAVIGLVFYALGIYLAQIYAATTVGAMIVNRLAGGEKWVGFGAIVGIIVFDTLRLIPVVGALITFLLIVFGLGAMSLTCWESWRRPPQTETAEEAA